jgi:predicted nuclease with RNAse H fold
VIAIDSPSGLALGKAKSRACERALAKAICGIRYTPDQHGLSASPAYYAWIMNGKNLYAALTRAQLGDVIEVFPTASWTRLSGSRVGTRAQWTRAAMQSVLARRVEIKGIPANHNQDVRDAIVAAYTALLHHRCQDDQSFLPIVVPK